MKELTLAIVLVAGSGAALDHWFPQIILFFRHLWELFVLWVRFMTAKVPVVGPLLSAAPGVHHGSPEEIEARRARRKAFAEADRLRAETAAAALAVDEAAAEEASEDPADELEKTQPFKPYLVKETA